MQVYEVGQLSILVANMWGEYEYYIRDLTDSDDVYKYCFSVEVPFTEDELAEREEYFWSYQQ